tara:strand:- start:22783 stop:23121 length:339 start_codon:yes stop_codon:yes gene_type:complete
MKKGIEGHIINRKLGTIEVTCTKCAGTKKMLKKPKGNRVGYKPEEDKPEEATECNGCDGEGIQIAPAHQEKGLLRGVVLDMAEYQEDRETTGVPGLRRMDEGTTQHPLRQLT